jgi:hypothetical protein
MNERSTVPLIEHTAFGILDRLEYAFLCLPKGILKVLPRAFDPRVATDLPGHDVVAIAKGHKYDRAISALNAIL